MKVKSACWASACRGRVRLGASDDESKRRLGPWGLPRDLFLRGATRCAARCRARAVLLLLAVFDGAFVGALSLEREFAFGVAHRVVGGPDTVPALPARGAGGELEAAHLLFGQGGLGEGVVLAAGQQAPEQTGELAC